MVETDYRESILPYKIYSDDLVLLQVNKEYFSYIDLYELLNDDSVGNSNKFTGFNSHKNIQDTYNWVKDKEEAWKKGEEAMYIIINNNTGDYMGFTRFTPYWEREVVDLGLWLHPDYWGNEISARKANLLLPVAFKELDLSVVKVGVAEENEKSIKAVKKWIMPAGRKEGVMRNGFKNENGQIFNIVKYSITYSEYSEKQS